MSDFRLTAAGRAMIADGENTGTAAVSLTRLALGSGSAAAGSANDGRTALITQRDATAVVGVVDAAGQVAYRGDFRPAASYSVTEAGLFGRVGAGGVEKMIAYWTAGGTPLAAAISGAALTVTGVLVVQSAAADVTITVDDSAPVNLGDPDLRESVEQNQRKDTAQDVLLAGLRSDLNATRAALAALQAAAITAATIGRYIDMDATIAIRFFADSGGVQLGHSGAGNDGVTGSVAGVTVNTSADTITLAAGRYWIEGSTDGAGFSISDGRARYKHTIEGYTAARAGATEVGYVFRGVIDVAAGGSGPITPSVSFSGSGLSSGTGIIFIRAMR